ncbi:protein of unknown function [Nakamurella panacisegetis]|uniref:Uncharacterized protein n=1 Tax=Nakamurella panacisegetis TaxID=1090615 RepID=A0A1H0P4G6_9ACTN|nr:DUF4259 domain-containing protein [Nakamurella panacisegetis]SDO99570.1 protein of unknown function [Nakamurella panacisegetis]
MGATGTGIFENDDALAFLGQLRDADPKAVGDMVSGALRAVAQSEDGLEPAEVSRALVALALLLSAFEPDVLGTAPDSTDLLAWFADLEIELNPARRQVATGAVNRIVLVDDNEWIGQWTGTGQLAEALAPVYRLRDVLADSASDE